MLYHIFYAVLAGLSGATGAVSGKYAFSIYTYSTDLQFFVLFLSLFIISNIVMWWAYTRSLTLSSSTIFPLVINMATNFMLSGIFGSVLFGESHTILWWTGLLMVISGISMMATDEKQKSE